MSISEFDRQNVGAIIGGHGDWFTAQLLRLVKKADIANRGRLRMGFPDEVAAVEQWEDNAWEDKAWPL